MERDKDALKILKQNISLTDPNRCEVYGGDSFSNIKNISNILKSKNEDDLKLLVEKLQKEIAKNSFSPVPSVTSSFGITIFKEGDNEESIQKRADDALYKAKEKGRNKVIVYK